MRTLLTAILLAVTLCASAVQAATLERIRETGVLKMGYREDAAPHSFTDAVGGPAGYSVNLCRTVALGLKVYLQLDEISIDYIPVSAEDRFQAVQDGKIDILCGATTATLSRRELVDFSLPTFIDGASVLLRADGPGDFSELGGHKVGVRAGTTTEETLRRSLTKDSVDAQVVAVKDHHDGLEQLEGGGISAYFADQAILVYLAAGSKAKDKLQLSDRFFTHEPYALALPRGDSDFRLAVDRALSRIYSGGAIKKIFANSFGSAEPSELVRALYLISALPE